MSRRWGEACETREERQPVKAHGHARYRCGCWNTLAGGPRRDTPPKSPLRERLVVPEARSV